MKDKGLSRKKGF